MSSPARFRRLHRAGRLRAIVSEFEKSDALDSGRRMVVIPWVADALAAVGRLSAADRLIRARLEDANNPKLDPAPIARLQLARLRVAVRAVDREPDLARRLLWQAQDWLSGLPAGPERVRVTVAALGGLVRGRLAERAGALDEALAELSAAARVEMPDPRIARRVRAVLDRCVAHRDPAAAFERRLAESRIAENPGAVQLWLARILTLPAADGLLDGLEGAVGLRPLSSDAPRSRARDALRRLALPADIELHRAVWRSALHRAKGDVDGAVAALEPLGRAGEGWDIARQLSALDMRPQLTRREAETLMRWWSHPDGAISMVARALVARALSEAGDLPGAADAARAAVRRIRAAETAPARLRLPAAWPGRQIAFDALYDVAQRQAEEGLDGMSSARLARIRRARQVARSLDAQD